MVSRHVDSTANRSCNGVILVNIACWAYICSWTLIPAIRCITDTRLYRVVFLCIAATWLFTSLVIKRGWLNRFLPLVFGWGTWFLLMLMYYLAGYGNLSLNQLVTPLFTVLCMLLGCFYTAMNDYYINKALLIVTGIGFAITSVTTIYGLSVNRNVVRLLTSASTMQSERFYLESRNIGSFGFVYGGLLILPALIIVLKNSKRLGLSRKAVSTNAVAISMIVACATLSNFTIAYILLGATLLLFFIPTNRNLKNVFAVLAVCVILFMPIITSVVIYALSIASQLTPSTMTQSKFSRIIRYLSGEIDISAVSVRFSLMQVSLSSFVESPLIGVGGYYRSPSIVGDHAQFVDDLARYGLSGTVPLLMFLVYFRKKLIKHIKDRTLQNAYASSWLGFLCLGFLNPVCDYGILLTVFAILPIFIATVQNAKYVRPTRDLDQ